MDYWVTKAYYEIIYVLLKRQNWMGFYIFDLEKDELCLKNI